MAQKHGTAAQCPVVSVKASTGEQFDGLNRVFLNDQEGGAAGERENKDVHGENKMRRIQKSGDPPLPRVYVPSTYT